MQWIELDGNFHVYSAVIGRRLCGLIQCLLLGFMLALPSQRPEGLSTEWEFKLCGCVSSWKISLCCERSEFGRLRTKIWIGWQMYLVSNEWNTSQNSGQLQAIVQESGLISWQPEITIGVARDEGQRKDNHPGTDGNQPTNFDVDLPI